MIKMAPTGGGLRQRWAPVLGLAVALGGVSATTVAHRAWVPDSGVSIVMSMVLAAVATYVPLLAVALFGGIRAGFFFAHPSSSRGMPVASTGGSPTAVGTPGRRLLFTAGGNGRASVGRALGLGGVGALVMIAISVVINVGLMLLQQPDPQSATMSWVRDLPLIELVVMLLAGVVVGPVVEELFFRGYVLRSLAGSMGLPVALVVSSVSFGVVHGQLNWLVGLIGMGFVLGHLYTRTGTLLTSTTAHVLNNGLAFVFLIFAPYNG